MSKCSSEFCEPLYKLTEPEEGVMGTSNLQLQVTTWTWNWRLSGGSFARLRP